MLASRLVGKRFIAVVSQSLRQSLAQREQAKNHLVVGLFSMSTVVVYFIESCDVVPSTYPYLSVQIK